MQAVSYSSRRRQLAEYFDHTAVQAWTDLTSDAPVSRIRATVRAGRDEMRNTLLSWLPEDLTGQRVLDAGCGTGSLSIAAARRGAQVTAVDLSPKLIEVARQRQSTELSDAPIDWRVGDMLDDGLGEYDYVVCMDSLIHYRIDDVITVLSALAPRVRNGLLFTCIPRTFLLGLMHSVGRVFPRSDRAPDIQPVAQAVLQRQIAAEPALADWRQGRTRRITSGFYISQAVELARRTPSASGQRR